MRCTKASFEETAPFSTATYRRTVRAATPPANGSSSRRTRFAVNRGSSRSHPMICSRHGSRLLTRGGDTRTGGVGRPTARRTVLTSNFNRRAKLVFPATSNEYKQARAEVESCPQAADEARTGDRGGDERVTPAGEDRAATAEPPAGGYYVVTTDAQRQAWSLPNLEHEAAAPETAPGDPDTRETSEPVPGMDPDEAIEVLFGDGASPSADPALVNGAVGEIFVDAIEARRRGRAGPGPVVNL